ncbi:MAG: Tyrosine recombinase XerD-like protein [Methanomethylovorans sp. PtaU1.Bin073]|jgi:integrase|uniref:tyrosine-type recombinase/integrase n=1 Tax=uncultured Methanomethylovorans sp. TaxID=183759 RepID=UPI0009D34EE7|nr:site-specific integrase [uncultured Methanomethylovorans sp.]OPY19177.1 MAG: Tyrosine recombinase XerD-like protein [Methanomethylovorans sp. PtaU1.Bin073]
MFHKREHYRSGEKALTQKEYEKLISVIDHLEDEVCIKLAISTGARREDLASIRIKDIDLQELKLSFYEQKKKRIHTVPLSPEMARLITQLINSRGKDQCEYIFSKTGRTAYTRLQKYCDKAGIPRRPFHALRATCIKRCQAAGWSIEQVAKLTGDTIAVIQEHYSWPSSSEMQEVAMEKPVI